MLEINLSKNKEHYVGERKRMKARNKTLLGLSEQESPATRWRCLMETTGDAGIQPPGPVAGLGF